MDETAHAQDMVQETAVSGANVPRTKPLAQSTSKK